jgi:cysteine sulfinate desulfinase/cysteine desulfurase-like protein
MTLNKFIKELQKLQAAGVGKAQVCIDFNKVKENNSNFLPDYSHFNVKTVESEVIAIAVDDDTMLANGQERQRTVVTLS